MRWILLLIAFVGFSVAFAARTPGLMGVGLLLGFVGLFAALFAFAAARIAATARPDTALLSDKELAALRARKRNPGSPTQSPTPGEPA
jgi:hypothetical protein